MIDFIIKSCASLTILLAFYHLLLKREKMYRFNRYYLLSAMVFSLILPFITIPMYVEVAAQATPTPANVIFIAPPQPAHDDDATNYWSLALWTLYLIGTVVFATRFVYNFIRLNKQESGKTTIPYKGAHLVLLEEKTQPFTFLNTIFLSKKDYENGIEPELFTHELAHASQKHTLDVLFTEIVLIVMWFNPLIYLYKHAIQLNHEFLADDAVINNTDDITSYQQLLLGKLSPPTTYSFVSSLNFPLTKTRFIMMTKKSSKTLSTVKQLALLPVLAIIVSQICFTTVQAQIKSAQDKPVAKAAGQTNGVSVDEYFTGVQFIAYDNGGKINKHQNPNAGSRKKVIDKKFEDLTAEERNVFKIFLHVPKAIEKKSPTANEFADFKKGEKYAIWIDGVNVNNSILSRYKPEDIASYGGSSVFKNARTKKHPQPFQYWLFTHKYFDENNMGAIPTKYPGDKVEISAKIDEAILQSKTSNNKETEIKPEYPGGISELYRVISKNYKSPDQALIKETVYVEFTVEEDGMVTNLKPLKASSPEVGDSVIKAFPVDVKWTPGTKNNKPVSMKMQLPVRIHME